MSQARKCFGASGLSFLLASWTLGLKMLALFYLGGRYNKAGIVQMRKNKAITICLWVILLSGCSTADFGRQQSQNKQTIELYDKEYNRTGYVVIRNNNIEIFDKDWNRSGYGKAHNGK